VESQVGPPGHGTIPLLVVVIHAVDAPALWPNNKLGGLRQRVSCLRDVMTRKRPGYPFIPKSAGWLVAGEFWALPLSDGSFGCGRVIQIPGKEVRNSAMQFLAGVLDWHSTSVPTAESIAGADCLAQGNAHIRAITRTGGEILGYRDLAADGIEPWDFREAWVWKNSNVLKGLLPYRAQTPDDDILPVLSTWGYNVACVIAEARFVKKAGPWARAPKQ
jgi:hypothetical protein